MYDHISIKYAYPAGAKFPILRNQAFHHHLMSLQQIVQRIGIKRKHQLIVIISILHSYEMAAYIHSCDSTLHFGNQPLQAMLHTAAAPFVEGVLLYNCGTFLL